MAPKITVNGRNAGEYDDLAVHRTLTVNGMDLYKLLNSGLSQFVPGASAIYLCNEGSGTTLHDYSGNGNDGTLGAGAAAPAWGATGLSFDGGDRVALALPAPVPTAATVTVVVNPTNLDAIQYLWDSRTASNTTYGYTYLDITTGDVNVPTGATLYVNAVEGVSGTTVLAPGTWAAVTAAGVDLTQYSGSVWFGQKRYSPANFLVAGVALVIVYPFVLTPAQVAHNQRVIQALMAARGAPIPFEMGDPPAAVMIQFDDGDATVYTEAYPILAAAGIPATAFIGSASIGLEGKMTPAQLAELDAAGWDIANHGSTHTDLTTLDEATQETKLATCAAYLDGLGLTRGSHHVAYPFGGVNADTLTAMAATGMLTGRTTVAATEPIPITAPHQMNGGWSLTPTLTLATAKAIVDNARPGEILTFYGHRIDSSGESSTWTAADLAALAAYIVERRCRVVTISQLWDYIQAGYVWA